MRIARLAARYWLEVLIVALASALVLVTFFQVVNRFLLHLPLVGTAEAARYISVWVLLLGAARAVRDNNHIQVDLFVARLPLIWRDIIDTAMNLLCLFLLAIIIYHGYEILEIIQRRRSPSLGISMYWVYIAAPFTSAIMFYFISMRIIRTISKMLKSGDES